jgi:hypothetical protein
MESPATQDRQVRAARNESLFRALNEKLSDMNQALSSVSETFVIACECADTTCVEMLDIGPGEYAAVRENPRRFIVLPGHVYAEVEIVTSKDTTYVVVEKIETAAVMAEEAAASDEGTGPT